MADEPFSDDVFKDVPLFRELQRVLFSGSGPVNWELARQVGIATAVGDRPDPEPTDEDRAMLEPVVRAAELAVADLTGLEAPPEVSRIRPVRRAKWVEASVTGLRGLFEPGAEKLGKMMLEAPGHELGGEGAPGLEGLAGLGALMGRMGPLLMGTQVGMVLGMLGRRALGQYDLAVPREGQDALLFVVPALEELEREWDLPRDDVRAWVAVHEVTHAFQLGRGWVREHFLEQIRELAAGMEFDLSGLEERLAGVDLSDPERLQEAIGDPADLLGQKLTDEQRLLMRRVQALMAAAEAHADHVLEVLGERMLTQAARIEEAMLRRREDRSEHERMAERLLGFELTDEHLRLGRAFVERVARATDERALASMWESAESLPSMPELEEPTLWLSRMA
ncbi:MAG TPA: zinc-dependent metalloprotease [Actinomycetota bacterium]